MSSEGYPRPWRETPLTESAALSRAAGCRIFLKHEQLQPSGCFKTRGVGNYMREALHAKLAASSSASSTSDKTSPQKVHFYCSSGGNAGLGAVCASHVLDSPCTVVVPTSTKPLMIAKIKAAGAHNVIQKGAHWQEADNYLREVLLAKDETGVYVPPYDHQNIWNGNATIIEEVQQQLPNNIKAPDAVVCSAGGGGLFCGVAQGIDKAGWTNTQILLMETVGADCIAQSLKAGKPITLPGITSKATSLGAVRPADKAFEYASRDNVTAVTLTDAEAAMGCLRLADDERILVELACGVNVALCYEGRLGKALGRPVKPDDVVVIVVCGGSNITLGMLNEYQLEFGDAIKSFAPKSGAPSDVTVGQT